VSSMPSLLSRIAHEFIVAPAPLSPHAINESDGIRTKSFVSTLKRLRYKYCRLTLACQLTAQIINAVEYLYKIYIFRGGQISEVQRLINRQEIDLFSQLDLPWRLTFVHNIHPTEPPVSIIELILDPTLLGQAPAKSCTYDFPGHRPR
jgi:hypothetical protein